MLNIMDGDKEEVFKFSWSWNLDIDISSNTYKDFTTIYRCKSYAQLANVISQHVIQVNMTRYFSTAHNF